MIFFDFNLIYPIFDVESIGDGPRGPRAHLKDLDFGFARLRHPSPVVWGTFARAAEGPCAGGYEPTNGQVGRAAFIHRWERRRGGKRARREAGEAGGERAVWSSGGRCRRDICFGFLSSWSCLWRSGCASVCMCVSVLASDSSSSCIRDHNSPSAAQPTDVDSKWGCVCCKKQ